MSASTRNANTPDEVRLLAREVRDKLVAVVIDANAYGAIGPDLERLGSLASALAKIDLQTWLPEPVVWEWAEHLASEWVAARNEAKKRLSHLSRAGLSAMAIQPEYKDRQAVIDEFIAALSRTPHVRIINLSGASAVEGLKDQILQRPPAKTKSDPKVKTGGSDSAWLRDVIKEAGSPNHLMFLSSDADIKQAWNTWGHGEPLMHTPTTIRAALFEDEPASLGDQWLVARYLSGRLPLDLDDQTQKEPGGHLVSTTPGLLDTLDLDWEEHGLTGGRLTRLTALAGLGNVLQEAAERYDPGNIPKSRKLRATVFFIADAETTDVFQFGEDEPVTESTASHTGLLTRTTLVFEVQDGKIISVHPDSETATFTASQYGDNWDAMEDVNDALTSVPGINLPHDWGAWKRNGEDTITVDGINHPPIEIQWQYNDYGGFTMLIGDEEAEVTCQYDDEAWVGGKEGFYMEPPYAVTVETPHLMGYGAWVLSAWVFKRLLSGDR
ncbi:hypothetical protein [Amycolatopsis sp. WAC 04197]|uniref:hypothetical protein n=1 Tax=Amycolatopsis sp. WAC 04197 TaxID=2203199 RepID=UPI000F7992AA|nr:hypothetical protein [Amycolatopsis sp. WAC 04197]